MPSLRFSGGTSIRRDDENMTSRSTAISPLSGFSSPAIHRRVVVLPHPLAPSRTEIAPGRNETDRSSMARTGPQDLFSDSIETVIAKFRSAGTSDRRHFTAPGQRAHPVHHADTD